MVIGDSMDKYDLPRSRTDGSFDFTYYLCLEMCYRCSQPTYHD